MFFYDTRPWFWLFKTNMKVLGVNLADAFPVRVNVADKLFKLIFEIYLILTSWVDLL